MKHKRMSNSKKSILCDIFAVIIACIFLFPLYWIVINSFKLDSEIFLKIPTLWPRQFTLQAYKDVIGTLLTTLKNSIIIAVGSMIISMVLSVPAAYGLAKFQIKGKKTPTFLRFCQLLRYLSRLLF